MDRYDIRKNDQFTALTAYPLWEVIRIDDDPDFGFTKTIGYFNTKSKAQQAVKLIQKHKCMNFAEWYYTKIEFYDNPVINHDLLIENLYEIWKTIGANLTIDRKKKLMEEIKDTMVESIINQYEEKLREANDLYEMSVAGDNW